MGNDNESEAALWKRALDRDDSAFTGLFDRHRNRVYRHVSALVPSRQDAEDVTATAFFELWRKRSRVRTVDGSVLPWLLVTATYLARNSTRGTRRYSALLASLPRSPDGADPSQIVEDRSETLHERKRILFVLSRLNRVDAALMILVVLEDLPVGDAAAALGLRAGAARTRLHRAKARARALLDSQHSSDASVEPGLFRISEGEKR